MTVFLGLLRDFITAVVGLLILFGVGISNDALAGILLVVSTAVALGTWTYTRYKQSHP